MALGFATGITITVNAHEYVYMTIATCFVRPHWRYRRLKSQYFTKDHALDLNLLDSYMRDAVGSFFLFFLVIGPVLYKTYVKPDESAPHEVDDTFADMLRKFKAKSLPAEQETTLEAQSAEAVEGEVKPVDPNRKITFEDYEALMHKLEKDGRMDVLEQANPKSRQFLIEKEWTDK